MVRDPRRKAKTFLDKTETSRRDPRCACPRSRRDQDGEHFLQDETLARPESSKTGGELQHSIQVPNT